VLYTLLNLGVLWDEPALLARADEVVERMAGLVPQDESLDIVRGAAGALGSLLAYHRTTGSAPALAAAMACGDHLLARSQPMAHGIGWVIPGFGATPLAGFAHGAAGMAWALLELAAASGQARYRAAAQHSLAYERSIYAPDARNWPDLRDLDEAALPAGESPAAREPRFMVAWCHGAAGIGLARLQALRHLRDGQILDEVDAALHTTLARGFGQTHCLCHGDLGNLELLLQAGRALDDARWQAETRRVAARVVDSLARDGWQCGGPAAAEMPSLMLGVAGIGYGLLRLAEPARVPSLLMLAPPTQ
jgi:lantibiotic modifying enzyme